MSFLSSLLDLDLAGNSDKIIAEYKWIGGYGMEIRSKARTLEGPISDPSKTPKRNSDGSSSGQSPEEDSEVICEPIPTNQRHAAASEVLGENSVDARGVSEKGRRNQNQIKRGRMNQTTRRSKIRRNPKITGIAILR